MPGSAAVGVRASTDDTLVADGTFSGTEGAPVQAGSTVLEAFGPNGLNAAENLQGTGNATNPFQEVNLFIGEMAKQFTAVNAALTPAQPAVGPRAAWERVRRIGDEIFRQNFS